MNALETIRTLLTTSNAPARVLIWLAAFALPIQEISERTRCCGCCQAIHSQNDGNTINRCPECSGAENSCDQTISHRLNCRAACKCHLLPAPLSQFTKRKAVVSQLMVQLFARGVPSIPLDVVADPFRPYFANQAWMSCSLTALERCVLLQRLTN